LRMMDTATLAQAVAGTLHGENTWFSAVVTDSRALQPGALFIALRGPHFDGHDFVEQAFSRGAAAALIASDAARNVNGNRPVVTVADTRAGLSRLATAWRVRFSIPVIAITGSNGKTTVKEMTAAILRAEFGEQGVLATEGNFNNDIGL